MFTNCVAILFLATSVHGHGLLMSFGTADRKTVCRLPKRVFRSDHGVDFESGNRCTQSDFEDVPNRWKLACKEGPDMWEGVPGYKSLQQATVDEGFCLGWEKGDFMRFIPWFGPRNLWGDKKVQTYCPGQTIEVISAYLAFHEGSQWIDMVPQSDEQVANLPICAGNDSPLPSDQSGFVTPCYWPNANPSPEAKTPKEKGTIMLHAPRLINNDPESYYYEYETGIPTNSSIPIWGKKIVKYYFDLPTNVAYEDGPITFRWMWMCGVDAAVGTVLDVLGTPELWFGCIDANFNNDCSAPVPTPAPVDGDLECSECLELCSDACNTIGYIPPPGNAQCEGEPRYFECKCADNTVHSFPGCECKSQYCPEDSTPTPAPTTAPTPEPTSAPTPEPTTAPTPAPQTTAAPTPTESVGEKPCDECLQLCFDACGESDWIEEPGVGACYGEPRYFECRCVDQTVHHFPGCTCQNQWCPRESQPTAAPTPSPVPTPAPTTQKPTSLRPEPTTPQPELSTAAPPTWMCRSKSLSGVASMNDAWCNSYCTKFSINNPNCCIGESEDCYDWQLCVCQNKLVSNQYYSVVV